MRFWLCDLEGGVPNVWWFFFVFFSGDLESRKDDGRGEERCGGALDQARRAGLVSGHVPLGCGACKAPSSQVEVLHAWGGGHLLRWPRGLRWTGPLPRLGWVVRRPLPVARARKEKNKKNLKKPLRGQKKRHYRSRATSIFKPLERQRGCSSSNSSSKSPLEPGRRWAPAARDSLSVSVPLSLSLAANRESPSHPPQKKIT